MGGKNGPLRWYRRQLSGGAVSNSHLACGCCRNEIFENGGTETNIPQGKEVVLKVLSGMHISPFFISIHLLVFLLAVLVLLYYMLAVLLVARIFRIMR